MPLLQSFAALSLTAAMAAQAPAPPASPADTAPPAESMSGSSPGETTAPGPTAEAPPATDDAVQTAPTSPAPPAESSETAADASPSESTPPSSAAAPAEPSASVTPPLASPAPEPEPPLQHVDAEAQERMRRGQKLMNISGIVMGSGAGLLVIGLIASIAAGRAPNTADYDDIRAYEDDQKKYQRRAFAGALISVVGTLGVIGGAIAFAIGGGKYRRGKKASRRVALTPDGTLRF